MRATVFRKIPGAALRVWNGVEKTSTSLWNIMTANLVDGVAIPRRRLLVRIEKGGVAATLEYVFLGRSRVREWRRYKFEDGKSATPDAIASTVSLAVRQLRAPRTGVTLEIPPQWTVFRTVELPSSTKESLRDVIGFELDRFTPFTADIAWYDFTTLGEEDGRLAVAVVAGKAAPIDSCLDALRQEGINVEKVRPVPSRGPGMGEAEAPGLDGMNLLGKGARVETRRPVAVTIVLFAALLATLIPYVALPLQREEQRLSEIERQISMRKEAVRKAEALRKEVRELADEVASIDDFKGKSRSTLEIMKELTTILPSTTWATRARITETTVDIEGYAKSASELLPKLERSPYLRKVEFASPTVRDARMDADRFIIRMEIEGFGKAEAGRPPDGKKK